MAHLGTSDRHNALVYNLAKLLYTRKLDTETALRFEHILHSETEQNVKRGAVMILMETTKAIQEELSQSPESFMNAVHNLEENMPADIAESSLEVLEDLRTSLSRNKEDFYDPFLEHLNTYDPEERAYEFELKTNFLTKYLRHLQKDNSYLAVDDYEELNFPLTEHERNAIATNRASGRRAA
jgi:hypothetical protein